MVRRKEEKAELAISWSRGYSKVGEALVLFAGWVGEWGLTLLAGIIQRAQRAGSERPIGFVKSGLAA